MANDGMTITIDGLDDLIKKVNAGLRHTVINRGLRESASMYASWSVKYRMSGQRPKYLDKISSFLVNSVLDKVSEAIPSKSGNNYTIAWGSDMPYAAVHEFGNKKRYRGRPYLKPALEDNANNKRMRRIMVKHIKSGMDRVGR